MVTTNDGSNTLFSKEYNQHYHNIDEGAIKESLSKHIVPSFTFHNNKKELNILDICFGLGYNSLTTLYYIKKENLNIKVNIYSPELDKNLIKSLETFEYPKEFEELKNIIIKIAQDGYYKDEYIYIEVKLGDAREYIKTFDDAFFDVVYQDAFSSEVNMELWTKEYFDDIYRICKKDSILTTYAIATPVRLSLFEANFFIYEYAPIKRRNSLCFKQKQEKIGKYIDMELKKQRNKEAKAIYDKCN